MNNILLAIISVFVGSVGQVVLKLGANKVADLTFSMSTIISDLWRLAKVSEIVLGMFLFAASSLLWIKVLTRVELSTAYPLVSIGYINVAVLSYFLFHESFSISKILGMAMIITGVVFINS